MTIAGCVCEDWIKAGVPQFSQFSARHKDATEKNPKSNGAKSDYFLVQWWEKNEKKTLWSISSYLWLNLCFQIQAGVWLISGMAVTEYKMQLKETDFSYAVPDTFTWGLIWTPSSKTFMWSRTHGSYSHRFIPFFCVLNRLSVLSSVGSPIPLLTLIHGALLRLGLISSVASSTGAAHYPSVVFLSPMSQLNPCSFTCHLCTSTHWAEDLISWNCPPHMVVAHESSHFVMSL